MKETSKFGHDRSLGARKANDIPCTLGEYAIPIAQRASRSTGQIVRGYIFIFMFFSAMIQIQAMQWLIAPLAILPMTRPLYSAGIRWTKAAFGITLVLITQLFAPTSFRITYDASTTSKDAVDWFYRDLTTGEIRLNWPKKVVMVANHQQYLDWLALWNLSYFAGMHAHVIIVLKKSLKYIPIIGWGMQFYRFIFLSRSWAQDKEVLTSSLSELAAHHATTISERPEDDEPLNFMIFPEGTLVSKNTLPVSKKYADKMGYTHPTNTLLPRSTGLHTSLIALSQLPSLYLMDVTMAYPGVPRGGYAQSYYTLRSIFMDSIPPPEIVYHVRLFNVQRDIPLQAKNNVKPDASLEKGNAAAQAITGKPHVEEVSEEDKKVFDTWLRERWMEKDAWLNQWHDRGGVGPLVMGDNVQEVVVPVKLRSSREGLAGFCYFIPTIVLLVYLFAF